jgi:DNA-binding transcriptional ArsR family regulator
MAGEIASHFESVSRPGISRHLRVLKECGVVSAERQGNARHYSICPEPLIEMRKGWLAGFSANQNKSLARLRKRVETNPSRRPGA